MPYVSSQPEPDPQDAAAPQLGDAGEPIVEPPPWSQVWQMPALILGVVLFSIGAVLAMLDRQAPDYPGLLDDVAAYVKAGNIDEARARIDALTPEFMELAPPESQARHALLAGDVLFLAQHQEGWNNPENNRKIIARYQQAMDMGHPIDDARLQRWAQTLVALGKTDAALEKVDAMSAGDAKSRYGVIRRIIDQQLASGVVDPDAMEPLRKRFLKEVETEKDAAAAREQQVFAVALRARLLLASQQYDELIDYLVVQQVPRLRMAGGDDDLAPLYILLAQAYEHTGRLPESQRHYMLTDAKIRVDEHDAADMHAMVAVGLGRIALAAGDEAGTRQALTYFNTAVSDYPTARVFWEALVGRADCQARLGMNVEALADLALAAARLAAGRTPEPGRVNQIAAIAQRHYATGHDAGDFAMARQYLLTLSPVFGNEWKPEILDQLASVTASLATQNITQAQDAPQAMLARLENPSAAETQQAHEAGAAAAKRLKMEAAVLFDEAGDLYIRHANALGMAKSQGYADSLWKGADAYDKAHQWKKSIEVLSHLVRNMPGEPRQVQAIYRLGMAYMADGEYPSAEQLFRQVLDDHPKSPAAYVAYVPLARSQIAMGKYDDAQRALTYVVNNHPALTPESAEYREALVELGRLLYTLKNYPGAIERLSEAVTRYGDSPDGAALRFLLADTYRQSIPELTTAIATAATQAQRAALEQERSRRLEEAQVLYSQVISQLEDRPAASYSKLETLYHRNAYFYRADCAYDLGRFGQTGRFEQALSLYDMAARRFDDEPASLIALVQMVNAYCELNRIADARAVNARARQHLKRIPEGAFDDPSLPLDRKHWEEWLRFTSEHKLFEAQASAGP